MNLTSIPCSYPYCNCREPKLHIGAAQIAARLLNDASRSNEIYDWKGLPKQKFGCRLMMRECVVVAYLEGRLK